MIKPASEALATNYEDKNRPDHYISEQARNYDKTNKALQQCTLKRSAQFTGKGRFNKKPIVLTLRPAAANTGIRFRRIDLVPSPTLVVDLQHIYTNTMHTSLIQHHASIHGIEHLLSALAGLGVDNVLIDINSDEMPVMDGSAEPFVFLIQSVGLKQQLALKRFIRVKEKLQVITHEARVSVEPNEAFQITCTLSSSDSIGLEQQYSTTLSTSIYAKSLSRARHDATYIARNSRRYENEAIRHHVLDTIGDFYMLGCPILGSFQSRNTNHALNHRLIRKLLSNPNAWELTEHSLQSDHQEEFTYY